MRGHLRRILAAATMLLLPFALTVPALGQGLYATVTGTVTDGTGAVIPGVTIRASALDTGIVSTTLTNEAGVYNYRDLLPGRYSISASLSGFQTKTITDVNLSQNTAYRYNFELLVASVNTQVEVSVSAETLLSAQGATVGQALTEYRVQNLPYVGNNILDLIAVMAGVENVVPTNPPSAANAFGRENTTFAGVRADNVMIVRDGINMNDNRSPNGIYSITTINPDLVGEVRLILAPVDVELGRGNGSIQYTTRSGTNRFAGSAVWSFRNTALDPNTWSNNRNIGGALQPNWTNTQQGTVSFGGPIVRNKTFFFGLFDLNSTHTRSLDNFQVFTPCARLGIFRYYNNWNSTNALGTDNAGGANPVRRAVDANGNPIAPSGPPPGFDPNTYDNTLQHRSVFGPLQSMPTRNDCADAPVDRNTLIPNGVSVTGTLGTNSGGWDQFRRQMDTSGYIARQLALTPLPNNYDIGDGLNTAGFRWLRRSRGIDNLFGSGEATGVRKQFNVKIDHHFTNNHKANVNWSYERVVSDDVFQAFPDTFSNENFRRPIVVTGGLVSTLSPAVVNEFRFGYRLQDLNVVAPMALPQYQDALAALFPPPANGIRVVPFYGFTNTSLGGLSPCPPHYGSRPPTNAPLPNQAAGCNVAPTSRGKTPTWTFQDTVSWSRGRHSFRFSGEVRFNSSSTLTPGTTDFVGTSTYASATLGAFGITAPSTEDPNGLTNVNSRPASDPNNLRGLQTGGTGTTARNLMNFLAGSLSGLAMQYYIDNPNVSSPPQISDWKDFRNGEEILVKVKQTEFTAWAKDEWKVTRNLTLTAGLRWDYTGVPYLENGTTVGLVGGGAAAFGISGRDFTDWMNPGVRADPTGLEFVGPNSPNPDKSAYPNIYNSFGPSLAFAWSIPWFGEGKTTIRGGYQITYSTGSPNPGQGRFSSYSQALSGAPGRTFLANANTVTGSYLDLSAASLNANLPFPPAVAPLQAQLTTGPRNQNLSVFDPNYANPYVQNLTLSVTRSVSRNITVDVRYIGTLSRKSYATQNLNINNFRTNGLLAALDAVRRGDDANTGLLDQIFRGINLCTSNLNPATGSCISATTAGVPSYGPIDGVTPGRTAAAQIRAGGLPASGPTPSLTSLANGDYNTLAGTISNYNYNWSSSTNPCVNCTLPNPNPDNNTVGAALRLNGFPDNFVVTNPQFNNVTYYTNWGYSNYHSLQADISFRAFHGITGSATYNWSKNLGLGALTDPTNRAQDYTNILSNPGHSLRANGVFELPIGPGKWFLGNSSGWLARAVERWQLGIIYNLSSGAPVSITAASMLYGNGVPDIRHPVDFNELKGVRWGIPNGALLEGRYFDNGDVFVTVDDPQCSAVTPNQNLRRATLTGPLRCTLNALAMVVPEGTPDSAPANTLGAPNINGQPDTRNVQIILQHPQPGQRGNLGNNTVIGLGSFRFDANLGKTFQISESKNLTVRFDAQNVLNHPQPGNPNLNINAVNNAGEVIPFGRIESKTQGRTLQGQLRLNF